MKSNGTIVGSYPYKFIVKETSEGWYPFDDPLWKNRAYWQRLGHIKDINASDLLQQYKPGRTDYGWKEEEATNKQA